MKTKLKVITSEKHYRQALKTIEDLWDAKPGSEQKDLVSILGSRSRVSEIMNHKRGLTLEMVRRLFDELHIPMEALIPRHV